MLQSGRKWRVGVMDCETLAVSFQTLDNPHLTEQQALSIVERWQRIDSGRRYNWLDGRVEHVPARKGV
mgnify:FL=1